MPEIKTESYQDIAFDGAWKGRGRALWAVAALGLMTGAAIGAIAPLFPLLAGVSVGLFAAAKSVAIFAAIGMTAGFAAGATIGNVSGGAAAVAKEQEMRVKQAIQESAPDVKIGQGVAPEQPQPAKSFKQRFKDNFQTYVNPRVMAVFATLGVIGGLTLAGGFIALGGLVGGAPELAMPALGTLLGGAVHSAGAVTAYFAGVMGSFGAIFGFNYPKMATDLTHYTGDVMSGEKLGRTWGPRPEPAIAQTPAAECCQHERPPIKERSFASYQDLIAARQIAGDNAEPTLKR